MNNRGKTNEIGLLTQTEGYLSWQDPESGEWMLLTPEGSPFTDGVLNRGAEARGADDVGKPRRICDRCATRNSNWSAPRKDSTAVA